FLGVFGGALLRASKLRRLPKRVAARDIALLGIATHQLTRILTRDRVTSAVRFPFTKLEQSAGAGEVDERPRGRGLRKALGTLLTCQFCAVPWTAAAGTAALIARPRETRMAASVLTAVTVADFLHQAYARARRAS